MRGEGLCFAFPTRSQNAEPFGDFFPLLPSSVFLYLLSFLFFFFAVGLSLFLSLRRAIALGSGWVSVPVNVVVSARRRPQYKRGKPSPRERERERERERKERKESKEGRTAINIPAPFGHQNPLGGGMEIRNWLTTLIEKKERKKEKKTDETQSNPRFRSGGQAKSCGQRRTRPLIGGRLRSEDQSAIASAQRPLSL